MCPTSDDWNPSSPPSCIAPANPPTAIPEELFRETVESDRRTVSKLGFPLSIDLGACDSPFEGFIRRRGYCRDVTSDQACSGAESCVREGKVPSCAGKGRSSVFALTRELEYRFQGSNKRMNQSLDVVEIEGDAPMRQGTFRLWPSCLVGLCWPASPRPRSDSIGRVTSSAFPCTLVRSRDVAWGNL